MLTNHDLSRAAGHVYPETVTTRPHRLRAVVCYYGQHYHAFIYKPEARSWFMFDDATVTQVGDWAAVKRKCIAGRIQPSVLFFADATSDDAC